MKTVSVLEIYTWFKIIDLHKWHLDKNENNRGILSTSFKTVSVTLQVCVGELFSSVVLKLTTLSMKHYKPVR